jgi:hypothetical protein
MTNKSNDGAKSHFSVSREIHGDSSDSSLGEVQMMTVGIALVFINSFRFLDFFV